MSVSVPSNTMINEKRENKRLNGYNNKPYELCLRDVYTDPKYYDSYEPK